MQINKPIGISKFSLCLFVLIIFVFYLCPISLATVPYSECKNPENDPDKFLPKKGDILRILHLHDDKLILAADKVPGLWKERAIMSSLFGVFFALVFIGRWRKHTPLFFAALSLSLIFFVLIVENNLRILIVQKHLRHAQVQMDYGNFKKAADHLIDANAIQKKGFLVFISRVIPIFDPVLYSPAFEIPLQIAEYHQCKEMLDRGEFFSAFRMMDGFNISGGILPHEPKAILKAYAARLQAKASYSNGLASVKPMVAVEALEEAYIYSLNHGFEIPFLSCDLAATLEVYALDQRQKHHPEIVVEILDRQAELVSDSPFVEKLLPESLHDLGNFLLGQKEYKAAIENLERAVRVTQNIDSEIRQSYALACLGMAKKQIDEKRLDGAIDTLDHAFFILKDFDRIQEALSEVLFARVEIRLRNRLVPEALEDLRRAAEVDKDVRDLANEFAGFIQGSQRRIDRFERAEPWLNAPVVYYEMPVDNDGDGHVDRLEYYSTEYAKSPCAIAEVARKSSEPTEFFLTSGEQIGALLRIRNFYDFNERIDFFDGSPSRTIIDIDRDHKPDVTGSIRMLPNGNLEVYNETPLSGRIGVYFESGVIKAKTDFGSHPDGYIKLFHNGSLVGTTQTQVDTQYPIFREGFVIDYKYQDSVSIELWDQDIRWSPFGIKILGDDFIDSKTYSRMPESDVVVFDRELAAVRLDVSPSHLPSGHRITSNAPIVRGNEFEEDPLSFPEIAHIIAGARHASSMVQIERTVAKTVAMELLLPRLLPKTTHVKQFMIQMLIERTIIDPLMESEFFPQ